MPTIQFAIPRGMTVKEGDAYTQLRRMGIAHNDAERKVLAYSRSASVDTTIRATFHEQRRHPVDLVTLVG